MTQKFTSNEVIRRKLQALVDPLTTARTEARILDEVRQADRFAISSLRRSLAQANSLLAALINEVTPPEPKDPITEYFDDGTGGPTIIYLRVAGTDVMAINAGDYRGFDIRSKTTHSAWSDSHGYVSVAREDGKDPEYVAKTRDGDKTDWASPIGAIKDLLGHAGVLA